MSAIDRAFIRAYEADEPVAARNAVERTSVERLAAASPPVAATPHTRAVARSVSTTAIASAPTAQTAAIVVDRRPLSAFAQPAQPVEARFKPSLEVDAFRWSAVSTELLERGRPLLQNALQTLLAADDAGRSLIGVGGGQRGAGATTMVACLARLLVEAGKSVAIVDADFLTAGLAPSLGLAAEIGWEDVLAGRVPLAESVVQSISDRVALVPLINGGAPAAEKLDTIHASVTAGVLRYHYDMVLFDLGAVADPVQGVIARRVARQCRLDGFVLTLDANRAAITAQSLTQTSPELAAICLGVIENQLYAV